MNQQDPKTLVKMANQIALNIPDRANVSQAVSAHIARFWAPSLIATLQNHIASHPKEVSEEVHEALKKL